MKIELTQLQADKIIEALKEKFQETKDSIWLGLRHNIESQMNSTWYKGHRIHFMTGLYWAQGKPFKTLKEAKDFLNNYYNTAEYRHKISQP